MKCFHHALTKKETRDFARQLGALGMLMPNKRLWANHTLVTMREGAEGEPPEGECQAPHTVHSHTVHLPLGALLIWCAVCGTGSFMSSCGLR
mgnify:CR=1 FL=1